MVRPAAIVTSLAKPVRRRRRTKGTDLAAKTPSPARRRNDSASSDPIKAAEEVALAAFSSGLRLAAAFGTVAAKTTSLALASLATGADRFSELVRKEALASPRRGSVSSTSKTRGKKAKSRRARKQL